MEACHLIKKPQPLLATTVHCGTFDNLRATSAGDVWDGRYRDRTYDLHCVIVALYQLSQPPVFRLAELYHNFRLRFRYADAKIRGMSIQDRAYAAAIFIVIGICCIGAYVAISGFFNANPNGITLSLSQPTGTATVEPNIEIPTETPAPPTFTPLPTLPPTDTPKGFNPSPPATE